MYLRSFWVLQRLIFTKDFKPTIKVNKIIKKFKQGRLEFYEKGFQKLYALQMKRLAIVSRSKILKDSAGKMCEVHIHINVYSR